MASENTKTLVSNISLSFIVKGISMVVALFTTPAYIAFFSNNEILGFWFTLLTVLTWILNCDMGVGNGLRNKLVNSIADNDCEEARRYISSSYFFLIGVAIVVLIVLGVFSQFIDWNAVFNVSNDVIASEDMVLAISIVIAAVGVQLILRLVTSILYALQKAFIPSLLNLITNVVLLAYSILAVKCNLAHGIVSMSVVYSIAVNLPLFSATIVVFTKSIPYLRPSLLYCDKSHARGVLSLGFVFLWLQFMSLLLNNTSSYLISVFISSSAVVEYQIYYKIFTLASTLVLLCTTPIWSAATKAQAEGDFRWLKAVFKKYCLIGIVITVFQFALCGPIQIIFDFWLGSETIQAQLFNSVLFAFYGSLISWSYIVTSFANGLNELKLQSIFLTIGAVANIPLGYVLAGVMSGYLGIVIANIIAYIPYLIVQTTWMVFYLNRKAVGSINRF